MTIQNNQNLSLGAHYEQVAGKFRAIFQRIAEGALEREKNRILPYEPIQWLKQAGFGAVRVPVAFGGDGVSQRQLFQLLIELAKADSNVVQALRGHFAFVEDRLNAHKTEPQTLWFERFVKGDLVGNAWTEIGNVEIGDVATRVTESQSGNLVVNGQKYYSTGTIFADWISVRALDPEGHVIIAIVPKNSEGLEVIDDWNGFGQRTTASGTVKLTNVIVDPFLILDERKLNNSPNFRGAYSQLIQVAIDVGIAEAAYDDTLSAIRKARPIVDANVEKASFEHYTLQEIGKLRILLDAAILLLDEAAEELDYLEQVNELTDELTSQASIRVAEAKVYANDAALIISEKLLELGGSRSSLKEHNLDQHWRNARVHTLHDPVRWKLYAIGNYYLNHKIPSNHAWI